MIFSADFLVIKTPVHLSIDSIDSSNEVLIIGEH